MPLVQLIQLVQLVQLIPSVAFLCTGMDEKEPFDIDQVFARLRRVATGLPKAAMFELRDRGYNSPFEQLVASLISTRTRDETTVPVCLRLFAVARTPEAFVKLDKSKLVELLY